MAGGGRARRVDWHIGGRIFALSRLAKADRNSLLSVLTNPAGGAGGRPMTSVAAGRKSLIHPKEGWLKLEYASFQANDDPALKLVIYTTV
jgi:hypothetical protein